MRRNHLVLIGLVALICGWIFFVWIARPSLVLPTVTIPLADNNSLGLFERQLKISALDVVVRTDGKISVRGDGQQLADLSYTFASLSHTADLAERTLLPRSVRTSLGVIPLVFPRLAWNALLSSFTMYYILPVETTVRFVYR
jgi:hypothetical protein